MNSLTNIVLLAFLFVLCLAQGVMLIIKAIMAIIRECKRPRVATPLQAPDSKGGAPADARVDYSAAG